MKFSRLVLFFLASIATSVSYADSSPLVDRWAREMKEKQASQLLADEELPSRRHFVFVTGFLNEPAFTYFEENRKELARTYDARSTLIKPESKDPIPKNAEELKVKILEIYQREQKPLVLVGHSKGGAEILYMLLSYPELMRNSVVEKAILLQPCVGGSSVAEYIEAHSLLRSFFMPFREGLASITRPIAQSLFESVRRTFHNQVSLEEQINVSKRIFYVRGYQKEGGTFFFKGTNNYLKGVGTVLHGDERNDGLLLLADQKLDAIGTELGIVPADHIGLVISKPISDTPARKIWAFTRALMEQVFYNSAVH